ncbi:hypothetical protein [Enterococcus casseliflavus]|nr:hypothetical protein [Enterococcus casseliflavus]
MNYGNLNKWRNEIDGEVLFMNIGEVIYSLSKYLVVTISIVASIYGGYEAIMLFKVENDEEKRIVSTTIAKAFGASVLLFLLYYIAQIAVKAVNVEQLTRLWKLLHFGNSGDFSELTAISVMMVILGIFLFIDKRKIHLS